MIKFSNYSFNLIQFFFYFPINFIYVKLKQRNIYFTFYQTEIKKKKEKKLLSILY